MPSKNQYDLVQNDDYDTRIPLHPDEAFHHGITFQAKYIGTLDVTRPTSRVEIVAAMRRIRYEFKAKGIKKKKVTIEVSVEGLRVTLRKKKKKKQWLDDKDLVLMHHPIYRIFYVSHDSQDLKIFSYIARDGSTNVFKCSVFKSNKKSQAMRVVRTVGQAFEVCHKLSVGSPTPEDQEEESSTDPNHNNTTTPALNDSSKQDLYSTGGSYDGGGGGNDSTSTLEAGNESSQNVHNQPQRPHRLDIIPPPPHNHQPSKSPLSGETVYSSPASGEPLGRGGEVPSAGTPLSAHHEMQLLREQLDQQCQQTQAAVAQIHLLRDQLAAETAARLEAQARIHQLLVHNKELLDHISSLVQHLQEQEKMQGNQPVQAIPQDMQGMYFPELEGRGLALLGTPFYLYQDQNLLRGTRGTTPMQGYYPAAALYPSTSTLRRSDLSVGRASSEPAPAAPPPQSPPSITTTLASLGLSEDPIRRSNAIQRSTSEKVPNRSELMSQVQRTAWARHTTK